MSIADIARSFAAVAPPCDEWSIRLVRRRYEAVSVTRGTTDPIRRGEDIDPRSDLFALVTRSRTVS